MKRAGWLATLVGALGVLVVLGFRAHRSAEERFADLSACLIGEPLAENETPSQRVHAIDMARLQTKGAGPESWPHRCVDATDAFSSAIAVRWWPGGVSDRAKALGVELAADREPSRSIDALWRDARPFINPSVTASSAIPRPWPPVKLIPKEQLYDVQQMCPVWLINDDFIDEWAPEAIAIRGKPGCTIEPSFDGRPLARLIPGFLDAGRRNGDEEHGFGLGTVAGWRMMKIGDGAGRLKNETTGAQVDIAGRPSTCNGGRTRVLMFFDIDRASIEVRFVDASRVSEPVRIDLKRPEFPGHGETTVGRSHPTLNCRDQEARIAWAWSTSVGGEHRHLITTASCKPGGCEIHEAPVAVETIAYAHCVGCTQENPAFVVSPLVIDLFDVVALVWSTPRTQRVRVAPLEHIHDPSDVVLRENPVEGSDKRVWARARGSTAVVSILDDEIGNERKHGYFFRIDASGVSALRPE